MRDARFPHGDMEGDKTLFVLRRYKEGKPSLGTVARELNLSITEAIDLLAKFGIQAPLEYDDYLHGIKGLKRI